MTKKEKRRQMVREKLGAMLDLPIDMMKGCTRMTVMGNEYVLIENYQGIMEYEEDVIRLSNHICLIGCNLLIEEITDEDILITGKIKSIEFES